MENKLVAVEQRSFLRRKVNLTVPICVLLLTIFLLSACIVSIASFYWIEGAVCYTWNNDQIIEPRPVYNSRPKRSLTSKKLNAPCTDIQCCDTNFDPNGPWNQTRLPTSIYPIEYQLTLELHTLNQLNDQYNGTVDIVLEVQSPTYDIILHNDINYTEISVSQRANPSNIQLNINCIVFSPDTQALTIHLLEQLQVGNVYDLRISFFRGLNIHGTGIFENQFNVDQYGIRQSRIILTHFKPVHAREAFPCFDEPGFKAKFQLTLTHENNTRALSNWDESESFWQEDRYITEFETVPPIATSLIAIAISYTNDFSFKTITVQHPITSRNIRINLWARQLFFTSANEMHIDAPLDMIQRIATALLNIFQDIQTPVVPSKIDILAVPEYPSNAVSHWGFIIFTERALLHDPYTTTEIEHQRIALLIAKTLAEQWYGNFVSFRWWTDLWLQEAIINYLKYYAVDAAYPEWTIHNQFLVEELLPTMFTDSMSTSHPIMKSVNSAAEIAEFFDSIETIKATAIFRMADYYMEQTAGVKNQTLSNIVTFLHEREYGFLIPDELLTKYQIGSWNSLDFFDRWLYQSNFPKISAQFLPNNIFQLEQTRFLSAHMYDIDLYPASTNSFNYIWYIPITCRFSNDSTKFQFTQTFYLDRPRMNISFGRFYFKYFYCNTDFAGYYIIDYTDDNWQELSGALDNDNTDLSEVDRANLLNNAFIGAQTTDESYSVVRQVTQFLYRRVYTGLLPWQTLAYHVNRMLDVLEYESLYAVAQRYFRLVVRNYYRTYETNLWNDVGTFSEQILKNLIIQLACRLQLEECVEKVTSLWYEAYPALDYGMTNHSVVDHARAVVYRTHFQNTYNDSEWITIESDYYNFVDVQERYRLLEALTQSRQPWHLYQLLYRDTEENKDSNIDLLEVLTLLSRNPNGRELVWLYYRDNWAQLQSVYGRTNQRLGQLLIDITSTFEDEFHEYELIDFLASTSGIDTNVDARFWALERANMNLWWIRNKSTDMSNSFDLEP